MTQADPSKLDRIEAILLGIAERQDRFQAQLEATQRIVESNARAIESEQAESRIHRRDSRQAISDLMSRNFENLSQHQEFRNALTDWEVRMEAMMASIQSLVSAIERWISRN